MGITPTLVTGLWTGWEDRAIHFRSMELGSGAAMAMPIWATYMQKVTAVPNLVKIVDEWPAPETPVSLELDCNKFVQEQPKKPDFIEE